MARSAKHGKKNNRKRGAIRKLLFAGLPPELKLPMCDYCPGDPNYDVWLPSRPDVKFAPEEYKLVDRDIIYHHAAPLPSQEGPFPEHGHDHDHEMPMPMPEEMPGMPK